MRRERQTVDGDRLRKFREKWGYERRDVADLLNVSKRTVEHWEATSLPVSDFRLLLLCNEIREIDKEAGKKPEALARLLAIVRKRF